MKKTNLFLIIIACTFVVAAQAGRRRSNAAEKGRIQLRSLYRRRDKHGSRLFRYSPLSSAIKRQITLQSRVGNQQIAHKMRYFLDTRRCLGVITIIPDTIPDTIPELKRGHGKRFLQLLLLAKRDANQNKLEVLREYAPDMMRVMRNIGSDDVAKYIGDEA